MSPRDQAAVLAASAAKSPPSCPGAAWGAGRRRRHRGEAGRKAGRLAGAQPASKGAVQGTAGLPRTLGCLRPLVITRACSLVWDSLGSTDNDEDCAF